MEGICHYCGESRQLSKEHVPPKAAFNNCKIFMSHGLDVLPSNPNKKKAKQYQCGKYVSTVCCKCNNDTGAWYADDYVSWAYFGAEHLLITGFKPKLFYPYHIFPLRVIKQIIAMFLAINGEGFGATNPYLRKFVLQKNLVGLPDDLKVYAYYCNFGKSRQIGVSASMNVQTGEASIMSEVNSFPFGYVLTFGSNPPDRRLHDITYFSRFHYSEFSRVMLGLPILSVQTPFPGDYRTEAEVYLC